MSRFGGRALAPRALVLLAAVGAILTAAGGASSLPASPISWTLVGTGAQGDADGQAREATLNQPRSVAVTADGGVIWGEPWSNRIRKVWPDGHVSTIAGTGVAGFSGDGGPATEAKLNFAHQASPTPDGGYVIADSKNCRIRKVSAAGIIRTVAGNGVCGFEGDGGPATKAEINNPRGVAAMPDGGFVIPDTQNQRVRRVWPDGTITTIAGTGVQGYSGDGGPATSAKLNDPFGVSPTADGGVLIDDIDNQRIRKVAADGTITTVAGTGVAGFSGDGGPATSAKLDTPHNVLALPDGSFLIADTLNNRIRLVAADGTISTIEGDGNRGYTGDGGPASSAELSVPKGIAVTPSGDIVIADEQNNVIRFAGSLTAPSNLSAPTLAGTANVGAALSATPGTWSGTGPVLAYQWLRCDAGGNACGDIAGATGRTYTVTASDAGATIRVRVTASNAAGSAQATSSPSSAVAGQKSGGGGGSGGSGGGGGGGASGGTPPPKKPPTASRTRPANRAKPVVRGVPMVRRKLTATLGRWSGTAPLRYAYGWQRCRRKCVHVGRNRRVYTLTAADAGARIRVVVTARNAAGAAAAASARTKLVAKPKPKRHSS